ncbi:MAG: hypothetical protein F6K16_03680 [Symploca sp. SIO2B6]|nr:hypothetical protein [Symploca sp. SIO2B6]
MIVATSVSTLLFFSHAFPASAIGSFHIQLTGGATRIRRAIALSYSTAENLEAKVKSDLNKTIGSDTSEKLKFKVDQALGKAQRSMGKMTRQAEGAIKQV